jgi:cell wall-associated NlpC family hydrolase
MHRRRMQIVRRATLACALAAALAPAASAQAATKGNWDRAQQREVARAGVMPKLSGGFHGEQGLTAAQLQTALNAIAKRSGGDAKPVSVPAGVAPTIASFHRLLVKQLGLADLARDVQAEAQRAGLEPPSRFGTEVVARQLGLRFDHPSGDDRLELYPTDTITRAEAAWSLARVLRMGYETSYARQVLGKFDLPAYTDAQRTALRVAVSKIGMPYVWGGETDGRSTQYGPQAHGGYDCSGFVWRVFKLSGNPAGERIGGRTTWQMAGEIARKQRIRFGDVKPADLLFFGTASFGGKPTPSGITHVGIALSPDFMIHSSSQGVYVGPLWESWRRSSFAWARRVL